MPCDSLPARSRTPVAPECRRASDWGRVWVSNPAWPRDRLEAGHRCRGFLPGHPASHRRAPPQLLPVARLEHRPPSLGQILRPREPPGPACVPAVVAALEPDLVRRCAGPGCPVNSGRPCAVPARTCRLPPPVDLLLGRRAPSRNLRRLFIVAILMHAGPSPWTQTGSYPAGITWEQAGAGGLPGAGPLPTPGAGDRARDRGLHAPAGPPAPAAAARAPAAEAPQDRISLRGPPPAGQVTIACAVSGGRVDLRAEVRPPVRPGSTVCLLNELSGGWFIGSVRGGEVGPPPPGWEAIDPCDPPHLFDPIHGLRFAIGGVSAAPPVPTRLFWGRERAGDLCWAGFCLELGPLDNLHEPIVARHGIDFTGGAVTAPPMPGVTLVYPYFQSKDPVEKIFSPLEIAYLASQLGSAVPPSGSLIARSRRSTTSSTGLQAPGRPSWACTSWSR